MPRENRKRGKKHKKTLAEDVLPVSKDVDVEASQAGPSWIVPAQSTASEVNLEAPFGYVDPDVKAYFKTVDQRIRQWQENEAEADVEGFEDMNPNEERRLFVVAAMTEMSGNEKELATDPDCSNVLERMAYSMDDFIKRVLMDRLAGSYEQLTRHRFGSHVIQTLLTVAKGTIMREQMGIYPPLPDSSRDSGELLTLTHLIVNLCNEILPSITSLILDPFASHVLRAIFILLCPSIPSSAGDSSTHRKSGSVLRSKKSAAHRAKQGPMKSILADVKEVVDSSIQKVPPEFDTMAKKFLEAVKTDLSENEIRALAADKVACPVLLILLEMEAQHAKSDEPGSLMDTVSVGLISACQSTPPVPPPQSDYLTTLLREPISSHLLETLITLSPQPAFNLLWEQYFQGKLNKLAVHPVANFVVARAMERLSDLQLLGVVDEMEGSWPKCIKAERTGVLRALIDRAAAIKTAEKQVSETFLAAFVPSESVDYSILVPCVLRLKLFEDYKEASKVEEVEGPSPDTDGQDPRRSNARKSQSKGSMEPTTQGAILLQSVLRLSEPHNLSVVESIQFLSVPEVLALSQHATSSRVIDILLDSNTVPSRAKRKFILSLIGHYHILVDDRIGSRVGDRCWASADPYLKEKIARSLIPQEQFLAASYYGKYFARNLHLHLLQRRPDDWKSLQSKPANQVLHAEEAQVQNASTSVGPDSTEDVGSKSAKAGKRKRDTKPEDEIDTLFAVSLGKKAKKGSLGVTAMTQEDPAHGSTTDSKPKSKVRSKVDNDLDSIIGAIRAAPKDVKAAGKKRSR